jgi:hypothetical protein
MNYKFITMLMLTGVMGSTQAGDHAEAVSKSRGGMLSPRNRAGSTIDSEMVILAGRARAGSQPIEIKSLNLSVMAGQEYDEAGYVEPGAPRAESRLSSGFSDDSKAWAWPEVDAIIDSEVSVPNRLYPKTSPDSSRSTTVTPRLTSPLAFASATMAATLPNFASAPVAERVLSPVPPLAAGTHSFDASVVKQLRLKLAQETDGAIVVGCDLPIVQFKELVGRLPTVGEFCHQAYGSSKKVFLKELTEELGYGEDDCLLAGQGLNEGQLKQLSKKFQIRGVDFTSAVTSYSATSNPIAIHPRK